MANFIPARAGYEIGNRFSKETGYLLKQTSLKLRNPANAPDEFESRILKRFEEEKKPKEYYEVITVNQEKFFLYMFPLEIKESCLKCHGDRENVPAFVKEHYKEDTATGYHLGDIRGAISVKVPYNAVLMAIWKRSLVSDYGRIRDNGRVYRRDFFPFRGFLSLHHCRS